MGKDNWLCLHRPRLLVVGPVCGIICGLSFREPLHANGRDLRNPVLGAGLQLEELFEVDSALVRPDGIGAGAPNLTKPGEPGGRACHRITS